MTQKSERMNTDKAWIVVDLVNDFVNGKFGSEITERIVKKTADTITKAEGKVTVIFTLDAHIPNDPEFRVWGEHCLIGTEGSELVDELKGFGGFNVRKRHFDAFYDSDLDGLLKSMNVKEIYISGISTDICVLHTASGAFHRYYKTTIIEDLCASVEAQNHDLAIRNMKKNYGFRIIDSGEFLQEVRSYE